MGRGLEEIIEFFRTTTSKPFSDSALSCRTLAPRRGIPPAASGVLPIVTGRRQYGETQDLGIPNQQRILRISLDTLDAGRGSLEEEKVC